MIKISKEKAVDMVSGWLDTKKVSAEKRDDNKVNIDLIVESVVDGVLSINDDFTIDHKLVYPFGKEEKITSVTYKSRLSTGDIYSGMEGVNPLKNMYGMTIAYVSALSGLNKQLIMGFDNEDFKIASAIVVFFM